MTTKHSIVKMTVLLLNLFIILTSAAKAGELLVREASEFQREATANELAKALAGCLDDAKVADAVYTAIADQATSAKPVAFVNGYWAKPMNLSAIYAKPEIATAMAENLSGNPAALAMLNDAVAAIEHGELVDAAVGAGMIFIPHEVAAAEGFADIIGLTDEIGSGAFLDDLQGVMELGANDFWLPIFTSGLARLVVEAIAEAAEEGEGSETGETGSSEDGSEDTDNDGVPDSEDAYPFDPASSITHCPPPGVCFSVPASTSMDLAGPLGEVAAQVWGDLVGGAKVQSTQSGGEYGMVFAFPKL